LILCAQISCLCLGLQRVETFTLLAFYGGIVFVVLTTFIFPTSINEMCLSHFLLALFELSIQLHDYYKN
jgi:hypothetical protein